MQPLPGGLGCPKQWRRLPGFHNLSTRDRPGRDFGLHKSHKFSVVKLRFGYTLTPTFSLPAPHEFPFQACSMLCTESC